MGGVGGEDGELPVPAEGTHAEGDDSEGTGDFTTGTATATYLRQPVDNTAGDAGRGVNVLAEEEGLFVDEDVAQDAAEGTGNHTHNVGNPKRIIAGEGFLDANHREERQAQGIEDEQHSVVADQDIAEDDYYGQRDAGNGKIPRGLHPKDRHAEQQVAKRTAPDGRHQADGVGAEPVEMAECGEADSGDGKGNRTDYFDCRQEC